jgi:hypothetical protein
VTITAAEALPGDVLLDSAGTEWKRGTSFHDWATFDGPVTYEGRWKARYGPLGELTLVIRGGKPVTTS